MTQLHSTSTMSHVPFTLPLAGRRAHKGRRIAAFLVDICVIFFLATLFAVVNGMQLYWAAEFHTSDFSLELMQDAIQHSAWWWLADVEVLAVVISIPYRAFFHASAGGATPGKWLFGLTVKCLDGRRLSGWRAIARSLSHYVFGTLMAFSYIVAFVRHDARAMHDLLFGTVVLETELLDSYKLTDAELGTQQEEPPH